MEHHYRPDRQTDSLEDKLLTFTWDDNLKGPSQATETSIHS